MLAQFHFSYEIKQFEVKGVRFQSHLYVPEKHPVTNDIFFEWEDEAHLIKVCFLIDVSKILYIYKFIADSKSH